MQSNKVGKVLSLFISIKESTTPIHKTGINVDERGIAGDKHYNTNIQRSVLITSIESYYLARDHQIEMPHSSLGENLLIDYNPYSLPVGSRLQIGNAILEISQNCTLCNHLSNIDKKLPKLLKNDRGIFGKVVKAGSIKVDDEIYLLKPR
jgi:MOSC domain-containing protein YiiM